MVKEFERNGRAGRRRASTNTRRKRREEVPLAGTEDPVREARRALGHAELKDRLLYRQAVETARCLAENVLTTVHDANVGSIFGIGFPAWTGGAMQFIYGTGIDAFCQRAAQLAESSRPRLCAHRGGEGSDPPAPARLVTSERSSRRSLTGMSEGAATCRATAHLAGMDRGRRLLAT